MVQMRLAEAVSFLRINARCIRQRAIQNRGCEECEPRGAAEGRSAAPVIPYSPEHGTRSHCGKSDEHVVGTKCGTPRATVGKIGDQTSFGALDETVRDPI